MGTSIVVTSGKGGTGKTSVTGGIASCLAAMGYRVLCLDLDIGLRNLDMTLGMSDDVRWISPMFSSSGAIWSTPPLSIPSSKISSSSPPR